VSEPFGAPAPGKYLLRELGTAGTEFYRRLAETGEVATTRCEDCQRTSFPPRERCPACGQELSWVSLPSDGHLYAFTTQEAAIRFRAPDVLALAQVGEVVLPGIALAPYSELRIGQPVSLEPMPEPETGLTLLAFRPAMIPAA
jgi:uncharacterized OB-fold protein